jgi:hypothetical protein
VREVLSKIWYYGTLPIYWFFAVITAEQLTRYTFIGSGITFFLFLMTWRTTWYWFTFTFVLICSGFCFWFMGFFYGFIGEIVVKFINYIQRLIDGEAE